MAPGERFNHSHVWRGEPSELSAPEVKLPLCKLGRDNGCHGDITVGSYQDDQVPPNHQGF